MAIVPPPSKDDEHELLDALPAMSLWVRGALVGVALGLTALFGLAWWLNPYQADGTARRMETHMQLGLPECTFKRMTGYPCPSCGMTTSFALTIRGDLLHGVQANSVGVLLALFLLAFIPWCIASAICRRTVFVRSVERTTMFIVLGLLGLMLLRWVVVLGLTYWVGSAPRF
ncbi:MAG TPA: DUF2752 domain-containing protein [Gemmataceae bacterium]|nr:DUF2752 domain-containing protein [Gemmataceae bacterium]